MTGVEYYPDEMDECSIASMVDENRFAYQDMVSNNNQDGRKTKKKVRVYKVKSGETLNETMARNESEMIETIEANGGTVKSVESTTISHRRYKRNRAKLIKKEAKRFA